MASSEHLKKAIAKLIKIYGEEIVRVELAIVSNEIRGLRKRTKGLFDGVELDMTLINKLKRNGLHTINDVLACTKDEILGMVGINIVSYHRLMNAIKEQRV